MLCRNRPEGFGPMSYLYPHSLTSCFLDTILIPLCTWLYFTVIFILFLRSTRHRNVRSTDNGYIPGIGFRRKKANQREEGGLDTVAIDGTSTSQGTTTKDDNGSRLQFALRIIYYLLLLAQFLMCVLEITRLSLANLGIGLLPFTLVTLIFAAVLRVSSGLRGRVIGWPWANFVAWITLAVCNGMKIAEEVKEGVGARKGTKYPESDEVTDVAVMVGLYGVLAFLEIFLER